MSDPTKFLLVRHGQTLANLLGIAQGQTDSPLTEVGRAESIVVAEKLTESGNFDAFYVSDLPRAVATAKILAGKVDSLPRPIHRSDIREIDFGAFSGFLKETIMPFIKHHKRNRDIPYPKGESGADFTNRVEAFFAEVGEIEKLKTVLVVTHYGVIETALRSFTDIGQNEPISISGEDVIEIVFRSKIG